MTSVSTSNRDGAGLSQTTSPMYQTTSNFAANSVGGGGSRIKVAVRIRPLLENERNQGHET
jgi:hypothetical protein